MLRWPAGQAGTLLITSHDEPCTFVVPEWGLRVAVGSGETNRLAVPPPSEGTARFACAEHPEVAGSIEVMAR
ncbi:MAG: hypothetical protein IRY95_04200 [Clostridia bacterium]|nr:hypothetical protein [Clostridia bacterium]